MKDIFQILKDNRIKPFIAIIILVICIIIIDIFQEYNTVKKSEPTIVFLNKKIDSLVVENINLQSKLDEFKILQELSKVNIIKINTIIKKKPNIIAYKNIDSLINNTNKLLNE
mgnify:CR=1 FL=1